MDDKNMEKYLIQFADEEVKLGKLLPEELPYVLRYWKRINKVKDRKEC